MPSIFHKRSSTPGSIPTTSSLSVGEIALNVPDGKIYIHKSGSAGDSIESAITSNSTSNIGTVVLSGSLVISGSTTSTNSGSVFDLSAQNAFFDFEILEFTGSAYVTGSLSVNTLTATGSLLGTASYATTASRVNTLNQNVLITGSLTVGATSSGSNENTLALGPPPAGGSGEGGQLLLQAPGGTYTSASMWDNWQNYTRLLRGTNNSSDAVVAQFNMHSKQVAFPQYNSPTAFTATTLVGLLGFDSSGNLLTTTTSSGGGGGGVTITNNTDNYIVTATGTANTLNGESNLQFNGSSLTVTGQITSSGAIISNANGAMYFRGGDDAEFWDINVANTVGIYGQQTQTVAGLKLGSAGATLYGSGSRFGIGTTSPTATLDVNGSLYVASGITGSLLGTASYAALALTASYALSSAGGGSGTVNSGTSGKVAYYPSTGTTVDDAGTLNWDNSNNSLGVGTTAPTSTNYKLAVNGGIDIADNTQAIFRIGAHLASSGYPQGVIQMGAACTRFDFEKYGGGVQFTVNDAGNAKVTTSLGVGVDANGTSGRIDAANDIVAFSSSDIRWKKNIKPIQNAIDKVKQISGNTFEWIEDSNPVGKVHGNTGKDVGVIAQEIEAILPEIVATRESGMKAVKYEKLVALLIEAIKEQQNQIEELKAKIK